ncbi:MAG: hypothetical protein PHY92_09395 [Alphaproteobacteria bacterium]|nr:hypothetical protein [Alphaproteobacteria bacterium]
MNTGSNTAAAEITPEGQTFEPMRPEQKKPALDKFSAADVVAFCAGALRGLRRDALAVYMAGRLFPHGLNVERRDQDIRNELMRQYPQLAEINTFRLAAVSTKDAKEAQAARDEWAVREAGRLGMTEQLKITSLAGATQRWVNCGGKTRFYMKNEEGELVRISRKGTLSAMVLA